MCGGVGFILCRINGVAANMTLRNWWIEVVFDVVIGAHHSNSINRAQIPQSDKLAFTARVANDRLDAIWQTKKTNNKPSNTSLVGWIKLLYVGSYGLRANGSVG